MSDYGLEEGQTWDFGEYKCWRFVRIIKTTPKYITFKLSNGTFNYGNQLHDGEEWRRKVLRCDTSPSLEDCFHVRIHKGDFRCFRMAKLTKPS